MKNKNTRIGFLEPYVPARVLEELLLHNHSYCGVLSGQAGCGKSFFMWLMALSLFECGYNVLFLSVDQKSETYLKIAPNKIKRLTTLDNMHNRLFVLEHCPTLKSMIKSIDAYQKNIDIIFIDGISSVGNDGHDYLIWEQKNTKKEYMYKRELLIEKFNKKYIPRTNVNRFSNAEKTLHYCREIDKKVVISESSYYTIAQTGEMTGRFNVNIRTTHAADFVIKIDRSSIHGDLNMSLIKSRYIPVNRLVDSRIPHTFFSKALQM